VSPTAADGHGSFVARVTVNLHQTSPDTTFTVTRAADTVPDGICTSTAFGAVATLQTSAGVRELSRSNAPGPYFNSTSWSELSAMMEPFCKASA
jgi:hypothetical protein